MSYKFDFAAVWDYRLALWQGLQTTLSFVALALLCGTLLGLLIALLRGSSFRPAQLFAIAWIDLFRGVPLLVQMFWLYFSLPILTGLQLSPGTTGVLALSLFMSALSAECFRAAAKAIGQDQFDAATALGLPGHVQAVFVVSPQMLMLSIPTWLSASVVVFKESALVSAVGIADLMYKGKAIAEVTARPGSRS